LKVTFDGLFDRIPRELELARLIDIDVLDAAAATPRT
jgi:phosphoribosyl-dephospho-CoA transferase